MIDALGSPQSILVLGATSDIAAATLTRLAAAGRLERAVLAARSVPRLAAEAKRVRRLGVAEVRTVPLEASDPKAVESVVTEAFDGAEFDLVLVAFGVLPDQQQALAEPAIAVDTIQVNFVGAAAACICAANALSRQGHGVLIVLSSVAAERPRLANFVYGSAKAGLDALCVGLGEQVRGTGASVLLVRPGFVHSAMTRGLAPAPLATTPAVVADAIATGLTLGSRVIWVPSRLRWVMAVLRHLPNPVFRRLSG